MHKQFLKFLNENDFESAESLLASDIFDVEDMMESMAEEDLRALEPHWSAVQTGEQITTPLEVLKRISCYLKIKEDASLVDIGSGHGHPAFVFSILNPSLTVTGYEIVKEKVFGAKKTADKLNLKNINFINKDMSDKNFKLDPYDYYYMYNPANEEILQKIVDQIYNISKQKKITVISAGGKDIKYLKQKGFYEDTSLALIGISIFTNDK